MNLPQLWTKREKKLPEKLWPYATLLQICGAICVTQTLFIFYNLNFIFSNLHFITYINNTIYILVILMSICFYISSAFHSQFSQFPAWLISPEMISIWPFSYENNVIFALSCGFWKLHYIVSMCRSFFIFIARHLGALLHMKTRDFLM